MHKPLSQYRSFHATVLTVSLVLALAGCRWFPSPHHGPHHPPSTTTTTGAPATTTTWSGSTTTAPWPSSTTTTVPEPTTTTTRPCASPDGGATASAAADARVFVPATAPPSTTTTSWPSTTIPPTTDTTDPTDTTEPDTTTTGEGTGGIVVEVTVLVDNCPDGLIPLVDEGVCADSEEYSCTSLDADGYAQLTGYGPTVTVMAFPNDETLTCPSVTLSHGDPVWDFEWQTATIICTHG